MISNYSKTVCLFTAGLQFAKHVLDSVVLNEAKFGLSVSQGLSVRMYGLLTKLVRSRWLDIGQVLFLRVYGPRRSRGP